MEKRKTKCKGYGMFTGICGIAGLGLILGLLIFLPIRNAYGWQGSPSEWAALMVIGIGIAYILLSIADWFAQRRVLAANPLPDELDLSERAVAAERLAVIQGCSLLHRHVRRLLAAWAAGASGPQVAVMAANQTHRMMGLIVAETAALFTLLAATAAFNPPPVLLTLGTGLMALLLLVALARFQLAAHLAGYVESNLLARIGNDTPAAAGLEFAQSVGKAVSTSTASLAAAQEKIAEQLARILEESAAAAVKAQQEAAAQVAKAQAEAAAQIAKTQQDAVAHLAKSQDQVAEQLGRLSELSASIDNIFKLQQAVDGALQGVAVSDEFKSTLTELQRHLAASDELLKAASKPRTIRLVEKENE
ncbi:MAG: hypothetical protein GX548_08340 [Lentisphaerae bacterium]|nr:hypothetical protein [Lentisphaerota bacterium]